MRLAARKQITKLRGLPSTLRKAGNTQEKIKSSGSKQDRKIKTKSDESQRSKNSQRRRLKKIRKRITIVKMLER